MSAEEFFSRLEVDGQPVQVCDTPVPYFRNGVPAGYPDDPGSYDGEYERIPKALLKLCDFIVAVRGDSMRDAEIHDGDDVIVKNCGSYDDGDIVVVYMDGEATLKAIYHDEEETWLVPANDAYTPIRLSDYQSVYILGRVTGVRKRPVRLSYAGVQRQLKKVKEQRRELTDSQVCSALTQVLKDIKVGRMWFCVYRVLADAGYLRHGDYEGLKRCADRLFPNNEFNINPKDIGRMDVLSFQKRTVFWDEDNAPVTGKRFVEYKNLAEELAALLSN